MYISECQTDQDFCLTHSRTHSRTFLFIPLHIHNTKVFYPLYLLRTAILSTLSRDSSTGYEDQYTPTAQLAPVSDGVCEGRNRKQEKSQKLKNHKS